MTLNDLKVGDNVEYYQGRCGNSISKESKVVKITSTQIHIEFKNGDAQANGQIRKFRKIDGKQIGKDGYYADRIKPIE